jgi:hypothetical protein
MTERIALLVDGGSSGLRGSLRLVLGVYCVPGDADNRLLLFMTSDHGNSQKYGHCCNSSSF